MRQRLLLLLFFADFLVVSGAAGFTCAGTVVATRVREAVSQWGKGPLAYSVLEEGIRFHFWGRGFIAYGTKYGHTFALGDPIAPAEEQEGLIRDFLATNPKTCFCAASKTTASIISDVGHYANEMGEVVDLDLATYHFNGGERESIRRGYNRVTRSYEIREGQWADIDTDQVTSLTQSWRLQKSNRNSELGFLARPLSFKKERDVRNFFVIERSTGNLVGYYIFDPMYENGSVIGYHLNFKRKLPGADDKTEEAVVMHATRVFQDEGREVLSLGLLPLHNVEDLEFDHSVSVHYSFKWLSLLSGYRSVARHTFNFQGHGHYKSRFRGNHSKIYFTTPVEWNAVQLFGLLRLCNVRIFGVL